MHFTDHLNEKIDRSVTSKPDIPDFKVNEIGHTLKNKKKNNADIPYAREYKNIKRQAKIFKKLCPVPIKLGYAQQLVAKMWGFSDWYNLVVTVKQKSIENDAKMKLILQRPSEELIEKHTDYWVKVFDTDDLFSDYKPDSKNIRKEITLVVKAMHRLIKLPDANNNDFIRLY